MKNQNKNNTKDIELQIVRYTGRIFVDTESRITSILHLGYIYGGDFSWSRGFHGEYRK